MMDLGAVSYLNLSRVIVVLRQNFKTTTSIVTLTHLCDRLDRAPTTTTTVSLLMPKRSSSPSPPPTTTTTAASLLLLASRHDSKVCNSVGPIL